MSPKSYRRICASHSSTNSSSGFSKGNLGLYVGKSVCEKNQSFTNSKYIIYGGGALGKSWTIDLRVAGSKPLSGDRFFPKSQFRQCFLKYYERSKSTVRSGSQTLHQSFRAQTAVLRPSTLAP